MSRIALTCGVFDLVHRGHVEHLRACREHGDALFVAVQIGGGPPSKRQPIMTLSERVEAIRSLRIADKVTWYYSGLDGEIVRLIKPHVLCVGPDWFAHDRSRVVEAMADGEIVTVPRTEGVSTTELRRRCAAASD